MGCYFPLQAWRGRKVVDGKREIVWRRSEAAPALVDAELKLPCGQCIGCRLERSRQWALRCVNEAQLYKENSFLTLTFNASHLPPDGELSIKPLQLFMKRLRKSLRGRRIKFFACGEYGEKYGRPHYHVCIFNWEPKDKVLWQVRDGVPLFRSASLEALWSDPKSGDSLGYASVGEVTFESAAYVARYCLKKELVLEKRFVIDGKKFDVVARTGEIRSPEFVTMSRGGRGGLGGIGKQWFNNYKLDIYPEDFYIVRGRKVRPPRYYDSLYELSDPQEFLKVKAARASRVDPADNDCFRLKVKEECKRASLKLLRRSMEEIS